MKKAISEEYKRLIIKPEQVVTLAKICYEPWRRDLEIAKRKWRNDRLPEIEKKIDEHNKDIEANKSTYSFNTYLPIGEQDKKAIIEKEKDFFIHVSRGVYEFFSKFEVVFGKKTTEDTSPDFLENLDLEKAKEINFSVTSSNKKKSIELTIRSGGLWDEKLKYRIEGNDDRWINSAEEEIKSVIKDMQNPHELTPYTTWIALISAILLSITFYQVLAKFSFFGFFINVIPQVNLSFIDVFAAIAFCIFSWIIISRKINPLFPNFAIKANYNPFDSNFIKVAIFVLGAIFSPLMWVFIQFIFI